MNTENAVSKLIQRIENHPDICEYSYYFYLKNTNKIFKKHEDLPLYPASLIKICIGAEVLRQIEQKMFDLQDTLVIDETNTNGEDALYAQTKKDFPVFNPGNSYTIEDLLLGMLKHSNNIASNTLIDLVSRGSINDNIIIPMGFENCILTRKFIAREKEPKDYQDAKITIGTSHFYITLWRLIEEDSLLSPFVSIKLKEFMKQDSISEKGLPFYEIGGVVHKKGGLLTSKLWNGNTAIWEHDSGVWEFEGDTLIFSVMTLVKNRSGEKIDFRIK